MEKRSYNRIPTGVRVEFDCNFTICCSAAINLSENGILLRTRELSFPLDREFEIFIHLKENVLILPVQVIRLAKSENIYDIIGVELIKPPQNYFDYVHRLRSSPQ